MTSTNKRKSNKVTTETTSSITKVGRKAYQYRLYPTPAQEKALLRQLEACRELYNAALQERRDSYSAWFEQNTGFQFSQAENGVLVIQLDIAKIDAPKPPHINYYTQANQLKAIRSGECYPELLEVNFSACQDVLRRVAKAFDAFFERAKQPSNKKAGYPRFKSKARYTSITWPSYGDGDGCKLKASGKVYIQNVGEVRFKQHRNVGDNIKTVTIRREGLHNWYVCFSCQYELAIIPPQHNGPLAGMDMGLEYYASLSDGEQIANPRYLRKSEQKLTKAQRKLAKLKSRPYHDPQKCKARRVVALCHRQIRNQRRDFQHKEALGLARRYSVIVVEDLHITNLMRRPKAKQDLETGQYLPNGASAKSGLAKSIADAGWGNFIRILMSKVEETGSQVVKVAAAGTSQECPDCHKLRPKTLAERWHRCEECGCEMPRDIASAKVILRRGLSSLGWSLEAVCFS
jgi:putative transposase